MKVSERPFRDGRLFWPPLISGVLVRRYKRFLADVQLGDGGTVTAHCPNSGRMTSCCDPGRPVYISRQDSPGRKLKYTWEMIEMPGSLVGVNTQVPNRLVGNSIETGHVPELAGYDRVIPEIPVGKGTRLDLLLKKGKDEICYVEVKNCTLVENGTACFPDAVTRRGQKHLYELTQLKDEGKRSVLFFLIQRSDASVFRPADEVDPAYGAALRTAMAAGVEALAYDVSMNLKTIRLNRRLPVEV